MRIKFNEKMVPSILEALANRNYAGAVTLMNAAQGLGTSGTPDKEDDTVYRFEVDKSAPLPEPQLTYFHYRAYNGVRLTLAVLPVRTHFRRRNNDDVQTVYRVGMALCHRDDSGSKKSGRIVAKNRLFEDEWETGVPGRREFNSALALQAFLRHVRAVERDFSDSGRYHFYHDVFFGRER